jgi:hypothetical protein
MVHSIKDQYLEASHWSQLSSASIPGTKIIVHVYEIWTHDGAHFIDAVIIQYNEAKYKRLVDLA